MAINSAVATGIYNALNISAVNTNLSGNGEIYFGLAPDTTDLPCIVFSLAGGGMANLTPVESHNLVYVIKGMAYSAVTARAIAGTIEGALKDSVITVSGYTNFELFMESAVDFVEVDQDGRIIYHSGAEYRIRLSE